MAKPKRDFANLTALISSGETELESRRLSVVDAPDDEPGAATPRAGASVLPDDESGPRPETPTTAARVTVTSEPAPLTAPKPLVQKLSLQLTEDTIQALYARQLEERRNRRKRGDTTIGWVADSLLRAALGLPALDQR
jgi:hypothetical protein